MSKIENKLKELNIALPPANKPSGSYVPAVTTGNLVFLAGQVPRVDGVVVYKGKMGSGVSMDVGYAAARICIINSLAALKQEIGDLDQVKRIVKLIGFINATPDFGDTPKVLNGASDLLLQVFGKQGQHARSAIGIETLPDCAVCEVEMIVELKD